MSTGPRSPSESSSNGIRITNREIYDLLLKVRDLVLEERERRRSLTTQVRLLWTLYGMLAAAVVVAGIRSIAG